MAIALLIDCHAMATAAAASMQATGTTPGVDQTTGGVAANLVAVANVTGFLARLLERDERLRDVSELVRRLQAGE